MVEGHEIQTGRRRKTPMLYVWSSLGYRDSAGDDPCDQPGHGYVLGNISLEPHGDHGKGAHDTHPHLHMQSRMACVFLNHTSCGAHNVLLLCSIPKARPCCNDACLCAGPFAGSVLRCPAVQPDTPDL